MLKPWRTEPDHESLFLQRYDRLVAQARGVLRLKRDQAAELVHEAFLQFVVVRPDLETIAELDGYLFGMVRKIHLSGLRRAARQRAVAIADYDSAAIALRDRHGPYELQALQELGLVCAYCAVRKDSSKAGSILALRYFFGYAPPALGRLIGATQAGVARWLHLARTEARLFAESPDRLSFVGQTTIAPPRVGLDLDEDERLAAFVAWLRQRPSGPCLTAAELAAPYSQEATQCPDARTLAHIISCEVCLALAEEASAAGDDRATPSSGSPSGGISERFRVGPKRRTPAVSPAERHRARGVEFRAHRPTALNVHVNGFLVGSHRLTGIDNELTVHAHLDEPFEFVEVFSEQGVRLALIDAVTLVHRREIELRLDGERSLHVSSDISAPWPSVTVRYHDPQFEPNVHTPSVGELNGDAVQSTLAPGHVNRDVRPDTWARRLRTLLPRMTWRALVWRVVALLLAGWILAGPSEAAQAMIRLGRQALGFAESLVQRILRPPPISSLPLDGRWVPLRASAHMRGAAEMRTARPSDAPTLAAIGAVERSRAELLALVRLQRIDAYLGQEVRFGVGALGRARIEATVANAERRAQLTTTLLPMVGQSLEIDVHTVMDAASLATTRRRLSDTVRQAPPSMQSFEFASDRPTAATAVLTHLGNESATRDFVNHVLDQSRLASQHAWALHNLSARYPRSLVQRLTAAEREVLASVIGYHAREFEQLLGLIATRLTPIFSPPHVSAEATEPLEHSAADYWSLAERLLGLNRARDTALRSAFVLRTSDVEGVGLDTAAFWNAVSNQRRIAQRMRQPALVDPH